VRPNINAEGVNSDGVAPELGPGNSKSAGRIPRSCASGVRPNKIAEGVKIAGKLIERTEFDLDKMGVLTCKIEVTRQKRNLFSLNKKILIVDDLEDNILIARAFLRAKGYDIIVARDGVEGLQSAQSENPDLILLDIGLPKMDGFHVCRLLKLNAKFKHIPIIMFTARRNESDQKMSDQVSADDYITKPYENTELLSKIEILLG